MIINDGLTFLCGILIGGLVGIVCGVLISDKYWKNAFNITHLYDNEDILPYEIEKKEKNEL